MWIYGPLLAVIGTYSLVTPGKRWFGMLLLCVGAVSALLPALLQRLSLKHFAARPDRDMLVSWEFHPNHVICKSDASSDTFQWRSISRVLQTPQGFLLYWNEQLCRWVPARAFGSAADTEAFVQLAKANAQVFEQRAR
jgi:hypothetical protein